MKIKRLKKIIGSILCAVLLFTSVPQMRAFAALKDIRRLGGSHSSLRRQKYDSNEYERHHLISRRALNKWSKYILKRDGLNLSNEFLLGDIENQGWAPAIIMEKADHEKTRSHICETTSSEQKAKAQEYMDKQADRLIQDGNIMGVLNDEINFIQATFGSKYDRAIEDVRKYIKRLRCRHIDHKTLTMNNPNPAKKRPFKFSFKK